ncbi:hypothetical protein L198_05913 [Cryptococcus wingfieldii CBS 7118]|uniref:FAD-binding domain-containing protein n=1 Tax=Cryptococcus wingfieldii CBS 7118 TaxID=1295528 RepID=A0A1E3IS41_9TREE|nr:hypothetical protein L198_05913 [Cryptococcus wingfieldii CBS 7118]ODN91399.1 hypothetical protein L198_05913 [Cryptococcus wingfieldii CBS 7118]
MTIKPQKTVLVVGAGVAGLAASYALRQTDSFQQGRWKIRIVEKRVEQRAKGRQGYPLHLSKAGREALSSFLTPSDATTLLEARQSIPAAHDGITISSHDRKKVFWTVREVGVDPMVERSDLMSVLRNGAGQDIEWGTEVIGLQDTGSGVEVMLEKKDGHKELITVDLPQTVINVRTTSENMREWIDDHNGLNLIYGESFSATMMPLSYPSMYIALTIPSIWLEPSHQEKVAEDRYKPTIHGEFLRQLEKDPGWKKRDAFRLWTAKQTLGGSGRVVLIGDAAHGMPPFCGAGASSAIKDAVELAGALTFREDDDGEPTHLRSRRRTAADATRIDQQLNDIQAGDVQEE